METIFLLLFGLGLVTCLLTGVHILCALLFGLVLFFTHGLATGHSWKEMLGYTWKGAKKPHKLVLLLALLGCLTAFLRACGATAFVVYHMCKFLIPSFMVLLSYWCSTLTSFLLGSATGTAATLGPICMALGLSMDIPPMLIGGAVLSGCYTGDRCSPISSTAHLVADLTKTNPNSNVKNYMKSSFVPFALASLVFLVFGIVIDIIEADPTSGKIFADCFNLSPMVFLPIVAMLVLTFFHFDTRKSIALCTLIAIIIAHHYQGINLGNTLDILIRGFDPKIKELDRVIGGGGLLSMWKLIALVIISSCYSTIFEGTGFLSKIEKLVRNLDKKVGHYATTAIVSVIVSMVCCNLALAIVVTCQLCSGNYDNKSDLAMDLENATVPISILIPWSLAGTMIITIMDAPVSSLASSAFLIILPIYSTIIAFRVMSNNK